MAKKTQKSPRTMAELGKRMGISAATVSRALAGSPLVKPAKRESIVRFARQTGFVMNEHARDLRLQRTHTLCVAIPVAHENSQPLSDPFLAAMIAHLAQEITRHGYGMLLHKVAPHSGNWLAQLVKSKRADGVIVLAQSDEHAVLDKVARTYDPLVVWGGQRDGQSYCSVGSDNTGGARAAVEHLLRTGRRRIAFLGDIATPEGKLRYQGYREALSGADAAAAWSGVIESGFETNSGYAATQAFLRDAAPIDAVFAVSDLLALTAMQAIADAGLSVPRDIAVVGFDDTPAAACATPPLSSVRQDLPLAAKCLVESVLARLEHRSTPSVRLAAELIVRRSSHQLTAVRPVPTALAAS
jgi:DNA-binding LacI/PurR family transcriptional regulator